MIRSDPISYREAKTTWSKPCEQEYSIISKVNTLISAYIIPTYVRFGYFRPSILYVAILVFNQQIFSSYEFASILLFDFKIFERISCHMSETRTLIQIKEKSPKKFINFGRIQLILT